MSPEMGWEGFVGRITASIKNKTATCVPSAYNNKDIDVVMYLIAHMQARMNAHR